jgi:hypothetical protein
MLLGNSNLWLNLREIQINTVLLIISLIEIGQEIKLLEHLKKNWIILYIEITTIKWCKSSQTVGHHLKLLSLRKPFMLGKNGIKVLEF